MKLVPGYDQASHIINGTPVPMGGVTLVPEKNPVEFGNALDFPDPGDGNFSGNDAATIRTINLSNAAGLSRDTQKDAYPIDLSSASDCMDEPTKGGLSYGPRNTGDY